jgi:hypothetical protein
MLGRDHALLGAVGYLAVAPLVLNNPSWETLGIGCVTSAAFALVPDIDEPGSTVSRKLGPLSRGVSKMTNRFAGGHRQATHAPFFVLCIAIGAFFAAQSAMALAIIVALSFLLVFRMLLPKALKYARVAGLSMLGLTAASAFYVYHHYTALTSGLNASGISSVWTVAGWFILATAGGCIWHMVGDSLTVEGIQWLRVPFVRASRKRYSLPLVGHCGSERETFVGCCLMLALIYLVFHFVGVPAYHAFNPHSIHFHTPHINLPGLPHPTIPPSITNHIPKSG